MSNFLKLINLPEAEGLSQIELDLNRRAKIPITLQDFFSCYPAHGVFILLGLATLSVWSKPLVLP